MGADSVQVDPETSLQEREKSRMLAPNQDCRMAVAHDSLVGIVTKHDSLGNTNEVFVAQTK